MKTSRCKVKDYKRQSDRTGYQVNLATRGGNTTKNTIRARIDSDYDELFVLLETGDCWMIPTSALVDAHHTINLGSAKPNKYDQYKVI